MFESGPYESPAGERRVGFIVTLTSGIPGFSGRHYGNFRTQEQAEEWRERRIPEEYLQYTLVESVWGRTSR